jgi:hypothetical protein
MPKYETVLVKGHWESEPETTFNVNVALGEWDGEEDDEDQSIFFYMEYEPLKVGDIIAEDFVVIAIDPED